MADKPETCEFLGKEAQIIKKSDGSEKIVVKTADANEILAGLGVTKEVREVVRKADDTIVQAAAELQRDRLLKLNKGKKEGDKGYTTKSTLVFGSGSGSLTTELIPHKVHNGKDIKTQTPYTNHKYGVFRVTKVYALCADLRKEGGLMDQMAADFNTAINGKK